MHRILRVTDTEIWIKRIKYIQPFPIPAQGQRQSASTQRLYTLHRGPVWLASSSYSTHIYNKLQSPQKYNLHHKIKISSIISEVQNTAEQSYACR